MLNQPWRELTGLPPVALLALTLGLSSAAEEPALDPEIETLWVTAERRREDPQQIPMSLSVFSGETLDRAGVASTFDLPLITPGLVVTTNTVIGQPYLRGVGSDLISAGADASVATMIDGVYQSRPVAAIWDLYDVERVEVLKGPQGTLFGRNATGGLIHVIHRRPEPELAAEVALDYGNFDHVRVRGFLNVPVYEDRIFARISGLFRDHDGYTRNLFRGNRTGDVHVGSVRGQLLGLPSDALSLHLSGDYTRDHSTRGLESKLVSPLSGSPAVLAGGTVPDDPRKVLFDVEPEVDLEAWGVSGRAEWEFEPLTFSSLSAYRKTRFDEVLDLDATEIDFASNSPEEESGTFTQEFQLTSNSVGAFEWLGGVYYLHESAFQMLDVRITPFGIRDRPSADLKADAIAVYANASYELLERFRISAGLRYSYERREMDYLETLNGAVIAQFDRDDDWDAWTPRFALEYFPCNGNLLYANISRGFKSGGFNTTVAQDFPFDPEFVWAYEIGFKTSLPDGWGHVNGAMFYYDYSDIQLQVLSEDAAIPFPLVKNAGEATIWGAEAQVVLSPVAGLTFDLSVAYLNAHFDDLQAPDPNDPAADPDQSGNRLPKAPEFSIGIGAEYAWQLGHFGTLTPRVDYRYQSAIYFDIFEYSSVRQNGYSLVNARLEWESAGGNWEVAVFGRNLADRTWAHSGIRLDGQIGNLRYWGAPRSYGFQVALRY
jgi:iron complex outermembrane receptor protein